MGIWHIAQEANVSIATVSRALNEPHLVKEKTRKHILRVAQDQGYQKTRFSPLGLPRINEIGVVLPDILNPFYARMLEGIAKQCVDLDYSLDLRLTHDDPMNERLAIEALIQKQVKGVIFVRAKGQEKESVRTLKMLTKHQVPFVLADRDVLSGQHSGVFLSNARAVYDAMNLLMDDGHGDILILAGPMNNLNSMQRIDGYRKALMDRGLAVDGKMIAYTDFSMQSGFEIVSDIVRTKKTPQVIFCCVNEVAVGSIRALREANIKIGKDVKVFSFNKLDASHLASFDVSYIEHPVEAMGEKSVVILNNKLVGTKGSIREIIGYKIVY